MEIIFKSVIMGIVEGLTEFLPVSSTGHLILAGEALGLSGENIKLFEVFIQLGAILAVVSVFRQKIFFIIKDVFTGRKSLGFCLKILTAFLPAAVMGLLTHRLIKQYLFGTVTVSGALVAGGIAILAIEKHQKNTACTSMEDISFRQAFMIGIAQTLALFPGISRSGATIMGGLLSGLSRKASTEFSFFLAIPTMFAAVCYDLLKGYSSLEKADIGMFSAGFITSFISGMIAVRWLLNFISTRDFRVFAWYRIIFGFLLLIFFLS